MAVHRARDELRIGRGDGGDDDPGVGRQVVEARDEFLDQLRIEAVRVNAEAQRRPCRVGGAVPQVDRDRLGACRLRDDLLNLRMVRVDQTPSAAFQRGERPTIVEGLERGRRIPILELPEMDEVLKRIDVRVDDIGMVASVEVGIENRLERRLCSR
nr:hypothetical protein [Methylobacterium sp. Leaf94]